MARDEVGYIEWPPELVGTGTLTAIDLKTGQLKWTCPVDPSPGKTWSVAGDYILQGRFAQGTRDGLLIHRTTGELDVLPLGVAQAAVPKDQRAWHPGAHVHGDWAVTDQIIHLGDKRVVRDLDFSWEYAVSHCGKLFTYGYRDRRMTHEYVLRRTDLETGLDELTVPVAELAARDGAKTSGGPIVAAGGDIVVISFYEPATMNSPAAGGHRAINLVTRQESWRAVVDDRFGRAPVQYQHPDGLSLANPIANWNPSRRRPMLIDLATGAMQPDPDWRDPYSLLAWHTGEYSQMGQGQYSLDFVARNEHHAVALQSKTTLICVDLETGVLVWKHEVGGDRVWPAITSTGNLGEYLMVPIPGGLEVFEISTGQRRLIIPADVGLTGIVQPPLPTGASIPAGTGRVVPAKHDWWIDGLVQSLVALPLVAWGVYLFVRRRTRIRQPPRNDSSH